MKKTAIILFAALTVLSFTSCQKKSDDTSSSVPESNIQTSAESAAESEQKNEPVNISDVSTDESSEESSEPEFIAPIQTKDSDYQSIIINNKCRLLLYTGTEQRIIVPDKVTVDGKEYETEIGAGCFKDTKITYLTLPDNITEIPESMCENCKQLTTVSFANVQSIGKNAFWQCENWKIRIDDLNFGNQDILKKIGDCAFGFSGLYGKVTIRPDMELEDGAFQICKNISEVEIQSGVTTVPKRLFDESHGITKITLPDTLTTIGEYAFYSTNIPSVTVPKSVTELGRLWIATENDLNNKYTGIMLGYKGTAAEEYANKNGIIFSALD